MESCLKVTQCRRFINCFVPIPDGVPKEIYCSPSAWRSVASGRVTAMLASPVWVDESEDLADCLLEHISRQISDAPRLSHAPIKALDLI